MLRKLGARVQRNIIAAQEQRHVAVVMDDCYLARSCRACRCRECGWHECGSADRRRLARRLKDRFTRELHYIHLIPASCRTASRQVGRCVPVAAGNPRLFRRRLLRIVKQLPLSPAGLDLFLGDQAQMFSPRCDRHAVVQQPYRHLAVVLHARGTSPSIVTVSPSRSFSGMRSSSREDPRDRLIAEAIRPFGET